VTSARRSRRVAAIIAPLVALGAVAACGGDNSGASTTTAPGVSGGSAVSSATASSALRPEDVIAPLAEVRAKLPALVSLGNAAKGQAASGDFEAAGDTLENLENLWFEVEGTVGDLDRNIYEAAETAQGLMRDGVDTEKADRVAQGADDQARVIQQFLDAHST
jgi:hypothetical protein